MVREKECADKVVDYILVACFSSFINDILVAKEVILHRIFRHRRPRWSTVGLQIAIRSAEIKLAEIVSL
jgi:hypothetical protein